MKTICTSALVLLITLTFSLQNITAQTKSSKIVATFKGVTENEYFEFVDDKNTTFLFYDMDEEIDLDLYEDIFLGKKFSVTWTTKEVYELDEDGNETEEKITVKTITAIKEMNEMND